MRAAVAWSRCFPMVLVIAADKVGNLRRVNLDTGEVAPSNVVARHSGAVHAVAVTPNGQQLGSGGG